MLSTTGRTSDETSLSLVCDENFGSGNLHRDHASQPLARIFTLDRDLFSLDQPRFRGQPVDGSRQGRTEPRYMHATVALWDIVGKAQAGLVIAVIPAQRDLDLYPVPLPLHR